MFGIARLRGRVIWPAGAVALSVVAVAACASIGGQSLHRIGSAPYERGSGTAASETRTMDAFHAVSASQGVRVTVSAGSAATVVVSGDDNLLAHITTEVRDGTLEIAISGSVETSQDLRAEVTAPGKIDAISVGSGATLDTDDLQAAALTVDVSSGATLRAGGTAQSLDLSVDSGSTADLRDVTATSGQVRLVAGSTAYVHVTGEAHGSCLVGSTLHVRGAPGTLDVEADVSSSVLRE